MGVSANLKSLVFTPAGAAQLQTSGLDAVGFIADAVMAINEASQKMNLLVMALSSVGSEAANVATISAQITSIS